MLRKSFVILFIIFVLVGCNKKQKPVDLAVAEAQKVAQAAKQQRDSLIKDRMTITKNNPVGSIQEQQNEGNKNVWWAFWNFKTNAQIIFFFVIVVVVAVLGGIFWLKKQEKKKEKTKDIEKPEDPKESDPYYRILEEDDKKPESDKPGFVRVWLVLVVAMFFLFIALIPVFADSNKLSNEDLTAISKANTQGIKDNTASIDRILQWLQWDGKKFSYTNVSSIESFANTFSTNQFDSLSKRIEKLEKAKKSVAGQKVIYRDRVEKTKPDFSFAQSKPSINQLWGESIVGVSNTPVENRPQGSVEVSPMLTDTDKLVEKTGKNIQKFNDVLNGADVEQKSVEPKSQAVVPVDEQKKQEVERLGQKFDNEQSQRIAGQDKKEKKEKNISTSFFMGTLVLHENINGGLK